MTHRTFLILLIGVAVLVVRVTGQHCTSDLRYTDVAIFDTAQITIGANVQYGTANDVQGNPVPLLMDLYYPNLAVDPVAARPMIVLFHGGGFSSGDKQSGDIRDLCVHMAMRGFVCASVNYRLGHDFSEYGQYKARHRAIQDGHAALRFISRNAASVRIDTNWLFVGGQSAGSLLALGMVYADQSELDSVSLLYGTTSVSTELGDVHASGNALTNSYSIKGVFNNWGGIVASEVDVDEMIPTIAFHGGLDPLVPIDVDTSFAHYTLLGSRAIHADMIANGVCSELNVDVSGGHGIYRDVASVYRAQRASCFFRSIFCDRCSSFSTTDSIPSSCSSPVHVDEQPCATSFHIDPNPFEGVMTIRGLEGGAELTVYNCFGQVVHTDHVTIGPLQLDVSSGLYILHVQPTGSNRRFTTVVVRQ
ncbi:MAG: alpha/beta hydrolase fold domain-containing protein [Bacteroidetes bacterium]|nr:alpha/beta hydrolase fold domain-containing protein [Bacteroidota bacterium]